MIVKMLNCILKVVIICGWKKRYKVNFFVQMFLWWKIIKYAIKLIKKQLKI